MKAAILVLFVIATVECRKLVQINKNANVDFINMESGGARPYARPAGGPGVVNNVPGSPTPAPAKAPAPKTPESSAPQSPKSPVPAAPQSPKAPAPAAPQSPKIPEVKPIVQQLPPTQPKPQPNQPDLKPVSRPASGPAGVTTPGYGKVKDLVTFYDSQGKASPIRPYSYSTAVKQG